MLSKSSPAAHSPPKDTDAPSRLHLFCSGLSEAAWLTAAALVPVFYNPYGETTPSPEKAALLHTLSLIIAASWIVSLARPAQGREQFRDWFRTVVNLPAAWWLVALIVAYSAATLFSIEPRGSLWGHIQTRTGFFTFLSHIILFAGVTARLRSYEQVHQLVNAIMAGSLVV